MSEAAFTPAVNNLLAWEGGYVNDPSDPGGETNFGITKRSYPNCDIRALSRDDAISIYHRDWWAANDIAGFPDPIGIKMLEMAVNMGWEQAVKLLQRAVNHCGGGLIIDGQCGPMSRTAIAATPAPSLLAALQVEDANFYRELAARHPVLRRFLKGWLRRAAS